MNKRYLLDTHSLLWITNGLEEKLTAKVLRLIRNQENELFLSIASAWEMGIKSQLGRLRLPTAVDTYVRQSCAARSIRLLPIELEDAARLEKLPLHHRDPFDRFLVVQSLRENLSLISVDETFDAYGVRRVW